MMIRNTIEMSVVPMLPDIQYIDILRDVEQALVERRPVSIVVSPKVPGIPYLFEIPIVIEPVPVKQRYDDRSEMVVADPVGMSYMVGSVEFNQISNGRRLIDDLRIKGVSMNEFNVQGVILNQEAPEPLRKSRLM